MEEWGGPAAFILLGVILIVGHIRKRRRENEAQVGMPPRSTLDRATRPNEAGPLARLRI